MVGHMVRLPLPADTDEFSPETRAAVRHSLAAGTREKALHAVDTHAGLDGLSADEALILVAVMSVYVMNANILRAVDVQPIPGSRLLDRETTRGT
jgi:hypothetical protein